MKTNCMVVVVLTLPLAFGCKAKSSDEVQAAVSPSAEPTGSVRTTAAVTARARIGGTVVATGDHAVEVLVHGSGRVEALVMDAKGDLVERADRVRLSLTVQPKAGARAKIDLKWEPPTARFIGQASAGVELAPGAVEVALDIDGKTSAGAAAMVALSAEPLHGGQIVVAGDYSVELVPQGELVYAFTFDASGKAYTAGDLALELALNLGGKTLALTWDAATTSYKGKLDAGIELEAKPMLVKVTAAGKLAQGSVASFKADAHANLDAVAYAKAKLEGDVRAKAGAALDVKGPEVSAQVSGTKPASASATSRVEIQEPTVKASASKSASVSAGTGSGAKASAGAKAGFSFGTH